MREYEGENLAFVPLVANLMLILDPGPQDFLHGFDSRWENPYAAVFVDAQENVDGARGQRPFDRVR